jgi:hypothetical protein
MGLEPPIIQPIAQRYITELSRLLLISKYENHHHHKEPFLFKRHLGASKLREEPKF